MVYVLDDPAREKFEAELEKPDTPLEHSVHIFTALCSLLFIVAGGLFLFSPLDGEFMLTITLGVGGLFIIALVVFFGMILRGR